MLHKRYAGSVAVSRTNVAFTASRFGLSSSPRINVPLTASRTGFGSLIRFRSLQKFHGLFVNGEHDATVLAENAVTRSGRIDDERTGFSDAVFVNLRSCENEDVFEAGVLMQWHATAGF